MKKINEFKILMIAKLVFLVLLSNSIFSNIVAQSVEWPLKLSASKTYLVDQNNVPYYLQLESTWKIYTLTDVQVDSLLDSQQEKGINGGMVWGPTSIDPNDEYFKKVDAVVKKYKERDMVFFVSFLRRNSLSDLTDQTAFEHGQMLGKRYQESNGMGNVIFMNGMDYLTNDSRWEQMALGVKSVYPEAIITFHSRRGTSSAEQWGGCVEWLNLNGVYTHHPPYWKPSTNANDYPYIETWHNWREYGKCMPMFDIEGVYEDEHMPAGNEFNMRKQHWWMITSGNMAGHSYGHRFIWKFAPGWQTIGLNDVFRGQLIHIKNFIDSIEWWKLIPDTDDDLILVGNKGCEATRVTACLALDGSFAVLYTPVGNNPIVDVNKLNGSFVAKWYNPATGEYEPDQGPFRSRGVMTFNTPNNSHDWVLLLDARK